MYDISDHTHIPEALAPRYGARRLMLAAFQSILTHYIINDDGLKTNCNVYQRSEISALNEKSNLAKRRKEGNT
jgi:hypothetical protein